LTELVNMQSTLSLTKDGRPIPALVVCPRSFRKVVLCQKRWRYICRNSRDGTVQPIRVSERNKMEDLTIVASRTHRDQRFNQLLNNY